MEDTKLNTLVEEISTKLRENVSNSESLNQWKIQVLTMVNRIAELKMSSLPSNNQENSSLDPVDWPSARCVAHEMLDSSLDYIQYVRNRPVCQSIPYDVRAVLENEPLPEQAQSLSAVGHEVEKYVMPYAKGNTHPRYWGWVSGEGTLGGVLADMISSTLNINACSGTHCAASIEKAVIGWMRQLFGFPEDTTGGLVTSGTSMATVISIAAARQRALVNVRQDGFANGHQLVGYASTETHGCLVKAFELLGLGSKALHLIPVDENFCIKIPELKAAILDDRNKGLIPFCLVGNAGTVNTGAFDNLAELSLIACVEKMWFHVDGAFGSFIVLDPQRRHLVKGIDQADSLVFDFHKWLHCPFDAGCVLVRNLSNLELTFSANQSYLKKTERDCSVNKRWYFDWGPELSRSFRALKVWFTLKEHGTVKLGQKIADNCEQAQYVVSLLEKHEKIIRIVRPVSLNIVNFRFEPKEFDEIDDKVVDNLNEELVLDIQTAGVALPSSTNIQNRLYIRIAIVSHRSTQLDFDEFVETLFKLYQAKVQTLLGGRTST